MINNKIKDLGKDTLIYGMGTVASRFISFLLFPIYTRVLNTAEYGINDLLNTALMLLTNVLLLGLDSGTAYYFYHAKTAEEKIQVESTSLWFETFLNLIITCILYQFSEAFCTFFFNDEKLTIFFRIALLSLPFRTVIRFFQISMRVKFQSKTFAWITAIGTLLQALLGILLVVVFKTGIYGILWANFLAFFLQFVISLIATRKSYTLTFSWQMLKAMLLFSLPLVPTTISVWLLNSSNRYFLARYVSLEQIGWYSAASNLTVVVTFVLTAFQTAWGPFAFSLINDVDTARKTFSKIFFYLSTLLLVGITGLTIYSRLLFHILTPASYEPAAFLIPWLGLGTIAWGLSSVVGIGNSFAKKNYHVLIGTFLGAIINIGLNIWIIPLYGINGAAIAMMCGHVVALTYRWITGQKNFPVPLQYNKLIQLVGLSGLALFLNFSIDKFFQVWNPVAILFETILSLIYLAGLFGLKIVNKDIVVSIIEWVSSWIKTPNNDQTQIS